MLTFHHVEQWDRMVLIEDELMFHVEQILSITHINSIEPHLCY